MDYLSRLGQWLTQLALTVPKKPAQWVYLCAYGILVLTGVLLLQQAGAVGRAVGSSLVATGIAGWVLFLYVWLSESRAQQLELLQQVGFRCAFKSRSVGIRDEYDSRLAHARSQIDIMGFGLKKLREDFKAQFPAWAARASVRILLLDPEFPTQQDSVADQRDKEEGDTVGSIRTDVREFVKAAASLIRDKNTRFDVRLYHCLPSLNMFRIDRELFRGPYLVRETSRNLPTFIIADGGWLFPVLMHHFDSIWADPDLSRDVPDEWLDIENEDSGR